ncbi:cysteine hydrolase family protein [Janthinobacterium sp.]|uniref:cysteine hydrolase family protein n=1 Tax=Janthinobacterium sp. TaxID=1871054 RepID=UPI00293D3F76|nr:cysteine hydrolase family protein [Janthinobacterium sp.]
MNQTIRSIGGASAATGIAAASSALLLIDFQNEYFDGRLPIPDGAAALANARRLVGMADAHGLPVFHIQHVCDAGAPLFAEGGATVAFHAGLQPAPRHRVLRKSTTSSFASTDLHAQLQARGIKTLIVAGLMTHMCVSTAVRDARQFGALSYQCIVAADACATRDLPGWDGGVLGHAELHRATLSALADNFAEILRSDAILALPVGE